MLVIDAGENAVEEFGDVAAGEGGVEACVESFVRALVWLVTHILLKRTTNYLSQLKPVVDFMFEWPHLDFTDELGLDLRITEHGWEQFTEMGNENLHFVMHGGIECCQRESVIAQITLMEHINQEWNN